MLLGTKMRCAQAVEDDMSLDKISTKTTSEVLDVLEGAVSDAQRNEIAKIIDSGIIDAAVDVRQACADIVRRQIGPDMDMAHKIDDQIRRTQQALIENLKAMR